jgi:hypothetical protein
VKSTARKVGYYALIFACTHISWPLVMLHASDAVLYQFLFFQGTYSRMFQRRVGTAVKHLSLIVNPVSLRVAIFLQDSLNPWTLQGLLLNLLLGR